MNISLTSYQEDLLQSFLHRMETLGISLSGDQLKQFLSFYEELVETNKVMNLTAITDFEEVLLKHFVDSCAVNQIPEFAKMNRIIDVGTGAGFPGIPCKIAFDEKEFVLLDSLNKRILFLEKVVQELGLSKISLHHGRAEDFAKRVDFREQFDGCVSRAVANLSTLSEYCLPFIRVGGYFIAMKGDHVDEELEAGKKAVELLGGKILRVDTSSLPYSEIFRSYVVIQKIKPTPKKFPRKSGLPSKEPLH